jgi:NADPH:quinone reductase-like Zn-dependent oxidoreductase
MKAVIWTDYGSPEVLKLRNVDKPTPKDNEVLVKIFATTVTAGDCEQRSLKLPIWYRILMRVYVGLTRPKRITILGMDLAGEIESVGKNVKQFRKGDQVFAATGFEGMGAYAEYICLPEETEEGALTMKPTNITYEEASAVPNGGLEALCYLRQGNIHSGQKVLINGAGGTIGTFAIQIAKYFNAEVTGVDSTEKLDILCSIGADQVIDYMQEDFTQKGEKYDFILDIVGKSSFSSCIKSLNQNGYYLIANRGLIQFVQGLWTKMTSSKKVIGGNASFKTGDLLFLKELIEVGKIKPVIDRCYPLEQIVEAHRYVETGQKKGQVVITIDHNDMSELH